MSLARGLRSDSDCLVFVWQRKEVGHTGCVVTVGSKDGRKEDRPWKGLLSMTHEQRQADVADSRHVSYAFGKTHGATRRFNGKVKEADQL